LKIGIIGTGSLGLALLAFFKKNNFDVYIYDKDVELLKKIERDGFEIFFNKNNIKILPLKVFKNFKRFPFEKIDFLIIAVKNYDLKEIAKKLPKSSFKIPVVLIQNGLGIEKFFKEKNNLYRFVCHLAVFKESDLKVKVRFLKEENFLGGGNKNEAVKIANAFCKAGVNTKYKEDINKYIWEKAILNSLLNPLSAIFKKNMKETLRVGGIDFIIKNILNEGIEVAKMEGIKFSKGFKEEALNYIKKGKEHFPSMVFDIEKGKTEIDFLNGMISKIGKMYKIGTPVNDFVVSLVKNLINDRNI
jgi:2-dehydropantoate 2-reductase